MNATLFSKEEPKKFNQGTPCLIYLHSHSGTQIEGSELVKLATNSKFSLCLFDFGGYGKSEGMYGTLGIQETDDLGCIIDHLASKHKYRYFYLWGRSMGAATIIRYCTQMADDNIKGIVLDSPFTDAKTMIGDILSEKGLPRFVTSICLLPISSTIKEKTGVDVLDNSPLEMAPLIKIPTFIMVGKEDTVTRPDRVKEIFSTIACIQLLTES